MDATLKARYINSLDIQRISQGLNSYELGAVANSQYLNSPRTVQLAISNRRMPLNRSSR